MSASVAFARHQFTVADYHCMLETGVLNEDSRVELLNGEIIKMSPIGSRHSANVKRLNRLLGKQLDPDIIIGIQDPIRLDNYTEPQPDVSVLKPQADLYEGTHPQPSDVLLVIEVADSTIDIDREIKLPAYARSGIAEVWLIDLNKNRIEVHANPHNGIYQEVRLVQRGQQVISKMLPQLTVNADDILG